MEVLVNALQVPVSSTLWNLLAGFLANFGVFRAGLYNTTSASTTLQVLVGSVSENPSVAIEYLSAVFLPQILFTRVACAWLRWIFPLIYGVRIVLVNELGNGRCDKSYGLLRSSIGKKWRKRMVILLGAKLPVCCIPLGRLVCFQRPIRLAMILVTGIDTMRNRSLYQYSRETDNFEMTDYALAFQLI